MNRILFVALALSALAACGERDDSKSTHAVATPSPAKTVVEPANQAEEPINDSTEKLFQNPFDSDAVYLLSQRSGTPKALTVLIKRDSQEGTQYSRWQFNCLEHTAQNLGVAANLQDLEKAINSAATPPQHYEPKTRLGAIASAVCP